MTSGNDGTRQQGGAQSQSPKNPSVPTEKQGQMRQESNRTQPQSGTNGTQGTGAHETPPRRQGDGKPQK